jgi:3-hydroxyanthranilate 3,4-dioxygenase
MMAHPHEVATLEHCAYHTRSQVCRDLEYSSAMRAIHPLNLKQWIDANRALLRPPVGNKVIHADNDFIVMVVGGPNARKDFHVDPADEFFYQIEGEMLLRVLQDERLVDLPIRAGEMLLLPPQVPHSPQRFADSVGLVIERRRRPGELDGLQWYCERCQNLLYEEFFALTDIERQFPPVFERFFGNPSLRTCKRCHTVMEPPAPAAAAHGA